MKMLKFRLPHPAADTGILKVSTKNGEEERYERKGHMKQKYNNIIIINNFLDFESK
jgi:hypothetical protein